MIIPLFNVENTLTETLGKIRCQRPGEVELVFVDDGSTDATSSILKDYLKKTNFPCQFISQSNQGAAAARNAAMNVSRGEYYVFLDGDDWWEEGAIDQILDLTDSKADIIGWDWTMVSKTRRRMRQADYSTPEEALRNLMGGIMKWNLWLFAISRKLIEDNSLRFMHGADIGEDMRFILQAFSVAGTVSQVHDSLYCYNASNPSSISLNITEKKRMEVTENMYDAVRFLGGTVYAGLASDLLPYLELYIKLPFLISLRKEDYNVWLHWFPESNAFAGKNRALPFRTRMLQVMAAKKMWGAVHLYNILVYKILDPIIH